jgi:hypothetical protein
MKSPLGTVRYWTDNDGEIVATDSRFSVDDTGTLTIYNCELAGEPPVEVYTSGRWFEVYVEGARTSAPPDE